MAAYEVTSPDGQAFEINAPDDATEEQVMAYAKTQFASMNKEGKPTTDNKPKASSRNWYDPVREALQGATFGFADEIGAGIAAVPASVATGRPLGETYRDMHTSLAGEREQYQKAHPGEALGLEVAGAIPTGLASGAKVLGAKALANVPRWAATAGVGAGEGALYGAGAADPGDTVSGAVKGGAIGGVAAPVAGAVGQAAGNVLKPIARSFSEHMRYTPKSQAVEVLQRVADDAGLTVDDIVEQYKKLGADGSLVDVDENFRGLMRALSDRSGTAKREARNVLESRQLDSVDRLIAKIEKTTGKKAGEFGDTVKSLKAERVEKASPLYDESWAAQPSQEMLDLAASRPSLKSALKKGERLASDEGEDVTDSLFRQFHYAKMAIDDSVGKAVRAGNGNQARVLIKLKNDLLEAMDNASPSYKQARDLYAGDSELLNAAEQGSKIFKLRPDEIDDIAAKMGQSEKELFKHGAVKAVIDKLEDSQLTHDNTRKLINSKTMQRKLSSLFDSPDDMRDFAQQAVREREFARTRQVVAGGSPTSQNTQMQKQLDDYAANAFSFIDGAKGGVISAVMGALKGKPITPETIDRAARTLLDNGLTEAQIRDIFAKSRIIAGPGMAPVVGNAARGVTSPAATAINQDR